MSGISATGADPNTLRQLNEAVVLRAMNLADGAVTIAAIASQTGLSRRPIEEILASLSDRGWVSGSAPSPASGAGRPARRFTFVPDHVLIASAHIDMRTVSVEVSDVHGVARGSAIVALADYFDPRACVRDAAAAVQQALDAAGRTLADVSAGAVASGGAIDRHGVVRRLINAPAWADFPLAKEMSNACGIPFLADNNANLAALGEHWRGVAIDAPDFAWAILGNLVGLGFVFGSRVYAGADGAAGELVETAVFNFDALKRQPVSWLTSPVSAERDAARSLLAQARNGDPASIAAIDAYVDMVFPAVVTMGWIIAPPLLVLGGGIEEAGDLVVPRMNDRLTAAGLGSIEVRASSLGGTATLLGGIRAVLDRFDVELFGPTVTG